MFYVRDYVVVCVQVDDDLNMILENQRVADQNLTKEDQSGFHPKRKRQVLSDQAYQLRNKRTDGLMKGLRNVREQSRRPHSPGSSSIVEFNRERMTPFSAVLAKVSEALGGVILTYVNSRLDPNPNHDHIPTPNHPGCS